jgi:hypothetical protein
VVARLEESKMSEMLYCRLVGRAFGSLAGLPPDIELQLGEILSRTRRLLARLLPEVPADELVWRIHFMVGGMLHMLTHREDLIRLAEGAAGKPDLALTVERFVRFAVAGLAAGQPRAEAPQVPVAEKPVSIAASQEPAVATIVMENEPADGGAAENAAEPAMVMVADGATTDDDGKAAKATRRRPKKPAEESPQGFFSF